MKFIDREHELFFITNRASTSDRYHNALVYALGISEVTRTHFEEIYTKADGIKLDAIQAGWQTSSSLRATRLAFNLYTCDTPTAEEYEKTPSETDMRECTNYSVDEIFSCGLAPYFVEAIKIKHNGYFTAGG